MQYVLAGALPVLRIGARSGKQSSYILHPKGEGQQTKL